MTTNTRHIDRLYVVPSILMSRQLMSSDNLHIVMELYVEYENVRICIYILNGMLCKACAMINSFASRRN